MYNYLAKHTIFEIWSWIISLLFLMPTKTKRTMEGLRKIANLVAFSSYRGPPPDPERRKVFSSEPFSGVRSHPRGIPFPVSRRIPPPTPISVFHPANYPDLGPIQPWPNSPAFIKARLARNGFNVCTHKQNLLQNTKRYPTRPNKKLKPKLVSFSKPDESISDPYNIMEYYQMEDARRIEYLLHPLPDWADPIFTSGKISRPIKDILGVLMISIYYANHEI